MKCKDKACGWFKEYNEGNYKSNCKMFGITKCDSSEISTKKPIKEVCEWEELEYKLFQTDCRMGAVVPDQISFDSYKFCHYCGKPIKIKE